MGRAPSATPRVAVLTNRIGSFVGTSGGGSAMREKLCDALRSEGHDLRLFAAGLHASADVGITDYSPMLLPTWRTLRAIWDMLREADLLIVSGSFTPCMPFGVAAARLLGVRTLVIFTTDSDKVANAYYTGLQRAVWWWMYSWCDRAVAALATRVYTRTDDFKHKLEELHGIRCMGVMSQSNQYNAFSSHISDPPEVLRHARRLLSAGRPDLPLLLYAGRWAPEKRIELLAANRPPGMVLAIVYPIKDEAKDDMVLALHDPANGIVCLPDYVDHDQLRIFYKAADVVVSASNFETAGHTAHEALLCGTPVVLQRTGGFVSQVEEGEQGFLVDWANPDDVQVATYRALALRHSGVRPRRLGAVEGTAIVREMMDADVDGMIPRSGKACAALATWVLRLPFLLLLLALYTVFPSTWPRSSRASDHAGSWEEEDERREAEWTSSPIHTCRHAAEGVSERKASSPMQVPYVLISLVVGTAGILLVLLLGLLLLTDTNSPAIAMGPLALASAHADGALHQSLGHAGVSTEHGVGGAQSATWGGVEKAPCGGGGMGGGWMTWVMAVSAGVALPLTLLSLVSVGALLVLACVLLSAAKKTEAKREGVQLSAGKRAEGYGQPLRAYDVCTRLDPLCNRVWLFDTTLRDGGQTCGVDFSVADKIAIARELDAFGIDYIEGGWPGANPTDTQFFAAAGKALKLKHAKLVAFGMTRRAGCRALEDPGLLQVLRAPTNGTCIFGKTWDFQVETALKVSLEENLAMIADSVHAIAAHGREPMFDCEHFFDGYKANPDYAVACARTAHEAGAKWVVLCDTNGGSLPDEVHRIVSALRTRVEGIRLGIHCHNDCGLAVANSLAAVAAGARQIQGTINGLGERCGNADLVTIVANLSLKTDFELGVSKDKVKGLRNLSRMLDQRLGRVPNQQAPYVGDAAFAHKGGVHASAVQRDARTYEHVVPDLVGNQRQFLVSNQAGRSNVLARLGEMGMELDAKDARLGRLIDEVKAREFEGWSFDCAEASFELLSKRVLEDVPFFFRVASFRVVEERKQARIVYDSSAGHACACAEAAGDRCLIQASVSIEANASPGITKVCSGAAPVAAVERAVREAVVDLYPALARVSLKGYRVRTLSGASCSNAFGAAGMAASAGPNASTNDAGGVLEPDAGSAVRVLVECGDGEGRQWRTVAVSSSVLDAFVLAYSDALIWRLLQA